MSFAVPVPRLPLISVLRRLDAPRVPFSPNTLAPVHHLPSADATHMLEQGVDGMPLGLGLMLRAAGMPILIPCPYLELTSQSPSEYSQRLHSIAPAPLQLASPTPQSPRLAAHHTRVQSTPYSLIFGDVSLALLDDTPKCKSRVIAVSVSPKSDCKASISSAMASQSTAPTSLVFPGESTNMNAGRSVDHLRGARQCSLLRLMNSPLSAFLMQSTFAGSSSARKLSARVPRTPGCRSTYAQEDPFLPSYQLAGAPPLLRRTEWVPLPEVTDEEVPSPISQSLESPLNRDLRCDLGIEDFALRAENCSETIARASLSLCSCSLLRDPEGIMDLCDSLRAMFRLVQQTLDDTPAKFMIDRSEAKQTWYSKHWQIMASLDRNLNLFYLLAHQIELRPPQIHRLALLVEKLNTYLTKSSNLARRISLSHEKLRFLGLRVQLSAPLHHIRKERGLRPNGRIARQEGCARRREIREEITCVRARIRTIRDRDLLDGVAPNDNSVQYNGDVDMDGGESQKRTQVQW
ncbi:hypothetical protein BC628DRAFT_1409530 [Trametes gibbosa]|nr:hypothetical protein BC628DRAFT_1409530 [Trametes gibbosa]